MAYTLPEALGVPRDLLAPFLVGFLKIRHRGNIIDNPDSLGSGTLVRLAGDVHGVLTAGHVLDVLPENTPIGLMIFTRIDGRGQFKIEIDGTQKVFAPGWTGANVPDLGFLKLDDFRVRDLKALGCVFYDLEKERSLAVAVADPVLAWRTYIVGVLAVSKFDGHWETGHARTAYTALIGPCEIKRPYEETGCELVAVEVGFDGPAGPPSSYGGVSGGGLWMIAESQIGALQPQRWFMGVAYYEKPNDAGVLQIICHTIADVELHLLTAVRTRFDAGVSSSITGGSQA